MRPNWVPTSCSRIRIVRSVDAGAGVSPPAERSTPTGVTTAAVIWVLAAIGCLIGVGMVATALVITLITIAVLIGVEIIEEMVERRTRSRISRELEGINIE